MSDIVLIAWAQQIPVAVLCWQSVVLAVYVWFYQAGETEDDSDGTVDGVGGVIVAEMNLSKLAGDLKPVVEVDAEG